MAVWLVRAGRYGERQDFAIENKMAVIGWDEVPDLSKFEDKDSLRQALMKFYPKASPAKVSNYRGQLWAFARRMQANDLVVMPLKHRSAVAVGTIVGGYEFHDEHQKGAKHCRPVKWLNPDMPRDSFDEDIQFSFGAQMTVCQIQRNNAEERIRAALTGKKLLPPTPPINGKDPDDVEITDITAQQDLEENAKTQIKTHIKQRFTGHKLAALVEAVLVAQGYKCQTSDPGPDGGVDIIAGRGPMGFDHPKLCVQVKSSDGQLDVKVMRELKGVAKGFGAEQCLLVAWGGFKTTVYAEARREFFEMRLWDAEALLEAILEHYDQFDEDLKADLPLKRIWTLVPETE